MIGERRSITFVMPLSFASTPTAEAPTTIVPSELPGETRHASISRLPADTITGIPAALAARLDSLGAVVLGTTAGLMIADLPAVLCGHLIGHRLDPRWPRAVATLIFAAQGVLVLSGVHLDIF